MSLPGILGTDLHTIPAEVPYLSPSAPLVDRWRERLQNEGLLRVGISWQGRPNFRGDHYRSIPLKAFAPLARIEGVRLLSLQQGAGAEQLAALDPSCDIHDLGSLLKDDWGAFAETAAVLQNLDLLITSDTAMAHLAGALAVPVWVALSHVPDWRWLLDRDDSPWYPTMRLFRQPKLGDWASVFESIAAALRDRAGHTAARGGDP
jgi:hypothetical protein